MPRLPSLSPSVGVLRSSALAVIAALVTTSFAPDPEPVSVILAGAGTPDDPIELDWRTLAGLNYSTGEVTEALKEADGKVVKIPGFTVPLEDFADAATEFLLVPYVGACVHTPPPPPNQLVYIEMADGKTTKLFGWDPVWLEGTLQIEMTESVYGSVGFVVEGTKVYPYQY